ncbi:g7909 [Coccomyxa elongata]
MGAASVLLGEKLVSPTLSPPIFHCSAGPDQLKLVQIVFRHGARTPLTDSYWDGVRWEAGSDCGTLSGALRIALTDMNGGPQPPPSHDAVQARTQLPGGCTKGELTKPGQRQARELGSWLRQRYIDKFGFLPPDYREGLVLGRTTNYRRTTATLQGVLTGLYPEAQQHVISIQTAPDVDEILFGRTDSCDRLRNLMKAQARALKESAQTDKRIHELERSVQSAMGLPEDHRVHFTDLHDALTSMRFHGKPLPQGMSEDLLLAINHEATRRMTSLVAPQASEQHGPEMLRLSMGPLFEQIVGRMAAAANGANTSPLFMYSGHDTTIMPILATLGVQLKDWPEYVSNVVFELWERKTEEGQSKHYVRVLYNKEPLSLAKHPQGEPIELEEFEEVYLKPYIVSAQQYREECKLTFDHTAPAPSSAVGGGSAVQGL